MPSFDLPALASQQGIRSDQSLGPIAPTQTLEDDLARIYLAPVRNEAARLQESVLPAYGQGSQPALKGALFANQTDADRDAAIGIALLAPFFQRVEVWHLSFWRRTVKAAVGIDIAPLTLSADTADAMDAALQRAAALLQGNVDELRKRLDTILWNGIAAGKTREQITADAQDALSISTRRARNTAEDQLLSFVGELNRSRQTQAAVSEYFWTHNPSSHPRWWHVARNGKVFSWAQPPEDGHPGSLPFCRCTARGIVRAN